MMTKKKKGFDSPQEGFEFVCSDGTIYREVSRGDIENQNPVFVLVTSGLAHYPLDALLVPIQIDERPFVARNGIECVSYNIVDDDGEIHCLTPIATFIGTDRAEGETPERVYLTPITRSTFPSESPSGFVNTKHIH